MRGLYDYFNKRIENENPNNLADENFSKRNGTAKKIITFQSQFKGTDFESKIQKLSREMDRSREEKMRVAQTQEKIIEKIIQPKTKM